MRSCSTCCGPTPARRDFSGSPHPACARSTVKAPFRDTPPIDAPIVTTVSATTGRNDGHAAGVGQGRADRHRATIGVQQRVDRLDPGLELPAGEGIQLQFDPLATAQPGLETFGQAEIDQHRGQIFQIDQVGTVLDVVAEVDRAKAQHTVKRRNDAHPCQAGVGQRQLGLGHLQRRGTFVKHPLGNEVLCHQVLVPFEVGLGNRHLRLRLGPFGLLQRVVELDQQLPGLDALAEFRRPLHQFAADPERQAALRAGADVGEVVDDFLATIQALLGQTDVWLEGQPDRPVPAPLDPPTLRYCGKVVRESLFGLLEEIVQELEELPEETAPAECGATP